ncbi:hypothetical protein KTN05_13580 [Paracoccus sp. Z118]|uniref:hypothetical protein n=1 Tax=Paracoccus sp. Z118 TaxID=2851017 RepID=UPI001C2C3B5F|nr:hypothetical protein [Paracoccus sp. Z118]MBV0892873.1 hypothetical protein [Paracoccus sp. Z118]
MILAYSGPCTSILEDELTSRPLQSSSTFFAYRVPDVGLRLTSEEWALIMGALRAYQHNTTYRPLYEKVATQTSGFTDAGVRSGPPGSKRPISPQATSRRP